MDYWGLAVTVTKFLHVEPTLMRGGASSPVQVQLRCALVGYAGDRGSVPSLKGAHVFVGSLQVSRDAGKYFVSPPSAKSGIIAPAGWRGYTPSDNSGEKWNSSRSPGNT